MPPLLNREDDMWKTITGWTVAALIGVGSSEISLIESGMSRPEVEGRIITLQQPAYVALTNHMAEDQVVRDTILMEVKSDHELMVEILKEVKKRPRLSVAISQRNGR